LTRVVVELDIAERAVDEWRAAWSRGVCS
jgi:hypothetical protein